MPALSRPLSAPGKLAVYRYPPGYGSAVAGVRWCTTPGRTAGCIWSTSPRASRPVTDLLAPPFGFMGGWCADCRTCYGATKAGMCTTCGGWLSPVIARIEPQDGIVNNENPVIAAVAEALSTLGVMDRLQAKALLDAASVDLTERERTEVLTRFPETDSDL